MYIHIAKPSFEMNKRIKSKSKSKSKTLKIQSTPPNTQMNYCMDVAGNSRDENTPVIMYPCHNGPNQKFKYNRKTRQIRGVYSNKCLDISSESRIVQRKCNPRKRTQKWKYSKGQFKSVYDKKCLDIEGVDYQKGQLITWPCHTGANQQFSVCATTQKL
jgi:hypothetical protein